MAPRLKVKNKTKLENASLQESEYESSTRPLIRVSLLQGELSAGAATTSTLLQFDLWVVSLEPLVCARGWIEANKLRKLRPVLYRPFHLLLLRDLMLHVGAVEFLEFLQVNQLVQPGFESQVDKTSLCRNSVGVSGPPPAASAAGCRLCRVPKLQDLLDELSKPLTYSLMILKVVTSSFLKSIPNLDHERFERCFSRPGTDDVQLWVAVNEIRCRDFGKYVSEIVHCQGRPAYAAWYMQGSDSVLDIDNRQLLECGSMLEKGINGFPLWVASDSEVNCPPPFRTRGQDGSADVARERILAIGPAKYHRVQTGHRFTDTFGDILDHSLWEIVHVGVLYLASGPPDP